MKSHVVAALALLSCSAAASAQELRPSELLSPGIDRGALSALPPGPAPAAPLMAAAPLDTAAVSGALSNEAVASRLDGLAAAPAGALGRGAPEGLSALSGSTALSADIAGGGGMESLSMGGAMSAMTSPSAALAPASAPALSSEGLSAALGASKEIGAPSQRLLGR